MRQVFSPEQYLLQDLRTIPEVGNYPLLGRTIFDPKNLRISLDGSLLEPSKRQLDQIVNGKNFFSDLWITKGYTSDEDARYMFSFDLQAFLITNSLYSGLYQNDAVATKIFQGFTVKRGQEERNDKAEILNLNMKKRNLHDKAYTSSNNLGTTANAVVIGPESRHPEVTIESPRSFSVALENMNEECPDTPSRYRSGKAIGGVMFFEGTDNYSLDRQAQVKGKYQYGVNITVKDPAASYLLSLAQEIRKLEIATERVYGYIVNSPPRPPSAEIPENITDGLGLYDYGRHVVTVPLERIMILRDDGDQHTAREILHQAISFYSETCLELRLLSSDTQNDLEKYIEGEQLPARHIEHIADLLGDLAYFIEQAASASFLVNASGEESLEKDVLERRGYCQRKMPVLEVSHYFDNCFEYGKDFGHGYAYIGSAGYEQRYGLRRVTPMTYLRRMTYEFNKYFYKDGPEQPSWNSLPYKDPAAQYFTPYVIRANGTFLDKLPQYNYASADDASAKYDLNKYGQLFAALVQYRSDLKYYNKSFSEAEYRDGTTSSDNRRLFNNVVDSLVDHHACTIEEVENTYFPVPKIQNDITLINFRPPFIPNVFLSGTPSISEESGPDAFRVILGGVNNNTRQVLDTSLGFSSPFVIEARNSKNDKFESKENTGFNPYPTTEPPIKLAFSILGEMEVDPEIRAEQEDPEDTYEFAIFNSLKNQAKHIQPSIDAISVRDRIESTCYLFPNQIKSAFVVALRDNVQEDLGSNNFDAKRFVLEDVNPRGPELDISFSPDYNADGYLVTEDPMKVYSKFIAFWMNYKQLACVEYLAGFETVGLYDGALYIDPPPTGRNKHNTAPGQTLPDDLESASSGITSYNLNHEHGFYIDENGNGWTSEARHPGDDRVAHRHRIINYEIQSAASACYPHCRDDGYLVDGVGPHIHILQATTRLREGTVQTGPRLRPSPNLYRGTNIRMGRNTEEFLDQGNQGLENRLSRIADEQMNPYMLTNPTTPAGGSWEFDIEDAQAIQAIPTQDQTPPIFRCFGNKLKRPVWKKITVEKIEEIEKSTGKSLLCRVRTFSEDLPVVDKMGMEIRRYSSAGLRPATSDLLDLPIYDEYFLLTKESSPIVFPPSKKVQNRILPGGKLRPQDFTPGSVEIPENVLDELGVVPTLGPGIVPQGVPIDNISPDRLASPRISPSVSILPGNVAVGYRFNPRIGSFTSPTPIMPSNLQNVSSVAISGMSVQAVSPNVGANVGSNIGTNTNMGNIGGGGGSY